MSSALALAVALWPAIVTQHCPPQDNTAIVGVAFNTKGHPIYCEYFSNPSDGKINVDYVHDGKSFATKQLDYVIGPFLPSVKQVDLRNGERREVKIEEDNIQLLYQSNGRSKIASTNIPRVQVDIIDAGFDNFVKSNWQELTSGTPLSVSFGSMIHQKPLPLRITSIATEKCSPLGSYSIAEYCFSVAVDNALLRVLLDNIKISYDKNRRLLQFNGVVNVQDDAGKPQHAIINYFYKTDYLK